MRRTLLPLAAASLLLAACTTAPYYPSTGQTSPSYPAPQTVERDGIRYQPVALNELDSWSQAELDHSLAALRQSCQALGQRPQWQAPCQAASASDGSPASVRQLFETRFNAWQISEQGKDSGLITGYFIPKIQGSLNRSARTPYPIYGVPADLLTVDIKPEQRSARELVVRPLTGKKFEVLPGKTSPDAGEYLVKLSDFVVDARTTKLRMRLDNGQLRPYYTRSEIDAGKGIASAPVIAWAANEIDIFAMQVQGSGLIELEDGSLVRAGYAEQNGHPYQSIGKTLLNRKAITPAEATWPGIQAWLERNPEQRRALFATNPSYVFFINQGREGAIGTLGVPLTDGYSVAVDPRYVPLGAPLLLSTSWPLSSKPLVRLMHAQDTGGAIRGAVRADFFWGFGAEAGLLAGKMKQPGKVWLLLPKGLTPPLAG